METVRLEKLLIQEVSGVDSPANQLDGWMVTKSAEGSSVDFLLVLAGEMEAVTKASASKEPYGDVTYADPGYQKDGKKRYPLDTEEHIRAAWSYVNQGDNADLYTSDQLAAIKGKIKAAMKRIGAEVADDTKKEASPESIVAKIKGILLGAPTEREDIDMEKDELVAAIVEGNEPLVKAVTDALAKSAAPAEGEGATEATAEAAPAVEATPALTVEDVAKATAEALEAALAPYNEIIEKALDRIEGVEKHLGVAARKSLDGQEANEGEPVEKSTPDLGDAISAAFRR